MTEERTMWELILLMGGMWLWAGSGLLLMKFAADQISDHYGVRREIPLIGLLPMMAVAMLLGPISAIIGVIHNRIYGYHKR